MTDYFGLATKQTGEVKPTSKKKDYFDMATESPNISQIPLDSVMTSEGEQTDGASVLAHFKAGFVDDPETMMKIYATTRFPDEPTEESIKRYGIHKGEVVYLGDDDKVYRETPDTWFEKIKRFAAQTGSRAPSIILGVGGAAIGPGTSAGGVAVGEMIRKDIATLVFDEPAKTPLEEVAGVATEVGLDVASYGGGKALTSILKRSGAKRGGRLATEAGRDVEMIDVKEAEKALAKGKKFGIDLYPPQTTESKRLIDKFSLLGDMPSSANLIQTAKRRQAEQVDKAVYKFLDDIAKPTTPEKAGKSVVEAAKKGLKRPIDIRRAKAKPVYQKAFKGTPSVDVKPVVDFIDDKLATAKGDVRAQLEKARKLLMKPDVKEGAETLDTTLRGLHDSKLSIDSAMTQAKQSGLGNTIKRNYQRVKTLLLKQMDAASPDYAKARKVFSEYSEEVEKQSKKTLAGEVAKLEGDQVVQASRKLFSTAWSSPENVKKARRLIHKKNPSAWDAALRTYLQDMFEGIKGQISGDIPNLGGWMHKKVFGNVRQREILKAALTHKQYNNLTDFMDVLRRSGFIFRRESATATRQVALKEMGEAGQSRMLMAATRPLMTYQRIIGDKVNEMLFGNYQKQLAEAMLSDKAASQLKRLKKLSPGSEQFLKQLAVFVGLVTGEKALQPKPSDIPIPKVLERSKSQR